MSDKQLEIPQSITRYIEEVAQQMAADWKRMVLHLIKVNELSSPIQQLLLVAWEYALTLPTYQRLRKFPLIGEFPVEVPEDFKTQEVRLDFVVAYSNPRRRDLKIGIECDSYKFRIQQAGPEDFVYSIQRDRFLELADWKVIRFAGRELTKNPLACAQIVLDYLLTLEPPDDVPF